MGRLKHCGRVQQVPCQKPLQWCSQIFPSFFPREMPGNIFSNFPIAMEKFQPCPPRPYSSLLLPSRLFIPLLGSVVAYLLSSLSSGPLPSQLCPGRAFFVPPDRIFQIWVETTLGDLLQSTLIHRAPHSPLSTPWITLHRSTAHLSLRASCRLAYRGGVAFQLGGGRHINVASVVWDLAAPNHASTNHGGAESGRGGAERGGANRGLGR